MITDSCYRAEPVDHNQGKGSAAPEPLQAPSDPEELKAPAEENQPKYHPEPGDEFASGSIDHIGPRFTLNALI